MAERPTAPTWALQAVAAGLTTGGMFLLAVTGSPISFLLGHVTPLPLWLVGLASGFTATLLATGAAAVLVTLMVGLDAAIVFCLTFAVPVLLLVRATLSVRRGADGQAVWFPTGQLVTWLVGTAGLMCLIGLVSLPGPVGEAEAFLTEIIAQRLEPVLALVGGKEAGRQFASLIAGLPAIVVVSWVLLTALNGVIAQALLLRGGRAIRPANSAPTFLLPRDLAVAVGFCSLFALLASEGVAYLAVNLLAILMGAYLIAGFAAMHVWARRFPRRGLVIAIAYTALLVLQWPLLGVAIWGIVDQWARLRQARSEA